MHPDRDASPKEVAELDETNYPITLNEDEDELPEGMKIVNNDSDNNGKNTSTSNDDNNDIGDNISKKVEGGTLAAESPLPPPEQEQHEAEAEAAPFDEVTTSTTPAIQSNTNTDENENVKTKTITPPEKKVELEHVKIVSKLPVSPSKSEERLEDTSFNGDILHSPSRLSRHTDSFDVDLDEMEIETETEILNSTNGNDAETDIGRDTATGTSSEGNNKSNDNIRKKEKFEIMELLESEWVRGSTRNMNMNTNTVESESEGGTQPETEISEDGSKLVQTENSVVVLDQEGDDSDGAVAATKAEAVVEEGKDA